jgi:sporulation protein YlmC with PRC-barrel domain
MNRLFLCTMAALLLAPVVEQADAQQPTGNGAPANPAVGPNLAGQISSLNPNLFYRGWRSRQLLGQPVYAEDGRSAGAVRDLIVDAGGQVVALIVESGDTVASPGAMYRVPWETVDRTPGKTGVIVDLSSGGNSQYGLFPGPESAATLPREFRLTEVLGDYARLQTGYGLGSVTDVVFSQENRMTGVLITRDMGGGGGTYAFPYPGTTGRWDPSASYYGLPYVTEPQAREAGLRVDASSFKDAASL